MSTNKKKIMSLPYTAAKEKIISKEFFYMRRQSWPEEVHVFRNLQNELTVYHPVKGYSPFIVSPQDEQAYDWCVSE